MMKHLNALRGTLTTWALRLMGWALIAVIILAIGFAVFIIPPPSLYLLVVFGVLMLVGILGQLMRFLVAEINPDNINGHLPHEAWQWFYMPHHQKTRAPALPYTDALAALIAPPKK